MGELGLTPEDPEQIRNYLEKPRHCRDLDDLVSESNEGLD